MTHPHMRAADLDRSTTCATLDQAFSDGQLDAGEHEERVSRAMAAKTLGELRTLVADLQPVRSTPAEPVSKANPGRRTLIAVAAAGLLLGAGLATVALDHSSAGSDGFGYSFTVGDPPPSPIVAPAPQLLTVNGFDTFLTDTRNAFGNTVVTRITVFDDHAVATRPVAGSGTDAQLYYFRGGYQQPAPVQRPADDTADVDLSKLDVAKILGQVAGASQSLDVDHPTSTYFEVDGSDGGTVTIHVANAFAKSGSMIVGIDGTVRQLDRASN